MRGTPKKTLNTVRMQLQLIELIIDQGWNYRDPYYLKCRRHMIIKKLLTLQLREFDNASEK